MRIYLLEITAYNPDLPGTEVLRFGSAGFQTSPTDTPANAFYEPRLEIPFNFERSILTDGYTSGGGLGGFGEAVLRNDDGELDYLLDYGFDGRQARLLTGDGSDDYADFMVLFTGTLTAAEFTVLELKFKLRDRSEEFDKEIQDTLYLGNNSLPNGIEGTEDDLKDKSKPLLYGYARNITPALVNTSAAVYQVHDGPVESIDSVLTSGVAVTKGADFATSALLLAAGGAPAAGYFTTCHAEGLFRLVQPYDGSLTATVKGDKTGGTYVNTVSGCISRVVTNHSSLTTSDLHSASFSAMASASTAVVGYYMDYGSKERLSSVLDYLCSGLGNGYWFFDREGKLRIGRLNLPEISDTPVIDILLEDILDIETFQFFSLKDGIPAYRTKLNYQRNWTPQKKSELAGYALDAGWLNWAEQEYRTDSAEDPTVQTKHLLAPELELYSCLDSATDAATENARLLALYKKRLDGYRLIISLDSPCLQGVTTIPTIGDIVSIQIDRFGMSSPKKFVIVSTVEDYQAGTLEFGVVG